MKLEHSMHLLCWGKMSTKCVNTPQRYINNAHQRGQLSSTLDKATRTILRADGHGLHTVNGNVGGILDRLFLHATRPGWNPGGAAPKRIIRAWESWWLQVWGWHLCLSWTFSVAQSKGHSGLATFNGTSFGTCGWEKCTQAIMISSKI